MTEKDIDKLSKFVKTVMKHKPAKDQSTKEKPTVAILNDKFIWKEGDLVIEKAPKKNKK